LIGSASSSKVAYSPSIKGTVVARSLQGGIVLYTDKDDWNEAMDDEGFTVVENDLTPLVEGASEGEIKLPKKTTTDVGKFDINLNDNSLQNWIWKYKKKHLAFEGLYDSSNGLKFENFDGGLACGFAGMWHQYKETKKRDIIIKVNGHKLSITDYLKDRDNKDTFIGIVVTEGFDSIEFVPPEKKTEFELSLKKEIEFNLYDISLSVECATSSSFPSLNPTQAPTEIPTSSQAPSFNPSQAPTEIPTSSQAPSFNPSQAPTEIPTSSQAPSLMPSTTSSPSATPSSAPSSKPSTSAPSSKPSTSAPSSKPSTSAPSSKPSTSPSKSLSPTKINPPDLTAIVTAVFRLVTNILNSLADIFG